MHVLVQWKILSLEMYLCSHQHQFATVDSNYTFIVILWIEFCRNTSLWRLIKSKNCSNVAIRYISALQDVLRCARLLPRISFYRNHHIFRLGETKIWLTNKNFAFVAWKCTRSRGEADAAATSVCLKFFFAWRHQWRRTMLSDYFFLAVKEGDRDDVWFQRNVVTCNTKTVPPHGIGEQIDFLWQRTVFGMIDRLIKKYKIESNIHL